MLLDAVAYMRGYHVHPSNARLSVGLPVPDIAWPENLFGNEIDQSDLTVEFELPPKSVGTRRMAGPDGLCQYGRNLASN